MAVPKDLNSSEAARRGEQEGWALLPIGTHHDEDGEDHSVEEPGAAPCSQDPESRERPSAALYPCRVRMNRWRKSVGEIQARRRPLAECERGLAALSRIMACYQQLATFLGSSSDCSRLREELEETRAVAYTISKGLQRKLMPLLTEGELGQDEREEVERLWVLFISGLEVFQQDLRKVAALQELFPLSQRRDRRALLNAGGAAGSAGGGASSGGVAARAATVQPPWIRADEDPAPDLREHAAELERAAQEMLQKVDVPFWTVESTQEAWAEEGETEPDGEGEEEEEGGEAMAVVEGLEVAPAEQDKGRGCCRNHRCRLRWVLCLLH